MTQLKRNIKCSMIMTEQFPGKVIITNKNYSLQVHFSVVFIAELSLFTQLGWYALRQSLQAMVTTVSGINYMLCWGFALNEDQTTKHCHIYHKICTAKLIVKREEKNENNLRGIYIIITIIRINLRTNKLLQFEQNNLNSFILILNAYYNLWNTYLWSQIMRVPPSLQSKHQSSAISSFFNFCLLPIFFKALNFKPKMLI